MESNEKYLWQIFVPFHDNNGRKYHITHHHEWDDHVRSIAGGLTIFKTSKGQWISDDEKLFVDRMIPVLIACTEPEIDNIIQFTMTHYDQLAIMCFKVSDCVKLVKRGDSKN